MSTNVYGPQNGPAPDFLRNTYDKQFQNLITTNFGELRPCFCKEVLPGDSVNIDPVVAIRSQPIVFPIQTRMKFYCHFFYGRNRILMKNWEDFIFKTKDGIVPPLLKLTPERAKKMISTGSLGDNLGVPSTYANSSVGYKRYFGFTNPKAYFLGNKEQQDEPNQLSAYVNSFDGLPFEDFISTSSESVRYHAVCMGLVLSDVLLDKFPSDGVFEFYMSDSATLTLADCRFGIIDDTGIFHKVACTFSYANNWLTCSTEGASFEKYKPVLLVGSYDYVRGYRMINGICDIQDDSPNPTNIKKFGSSVGFNNQWFYDTTDGVVDATDDAVLYLNKFVGPNPQIPLSSLPWRLYEFCCNYYYRNDTNNPYMLDNEPQYNKFIPSTDDGWDENEYLIHKRNWESDMFTTCVPSPQFGTAPLVGLTYNGGLTAEVTTNVTDSDGQTKQLAIKVGVDDEGNINNIFNADTAVPSGSLKALMDAMSTTGISINTLRNVNSFQRFLENVIRRGLRYRNQLLSHFGVSVDYPDIDIPQFIGGFSGDLVVRDVTNMAESAEVALGDVAGKIDAVIQSNHSINCYCAEHGFIMGIFCIVPVPTYSQVLPHMFTRYDAFDYFQKEFDKIGYVPVTYRNFLPLQADNPDEVFGYQRAWYEYMSSLDEVHGDFRLSLDDFVLYRIFKDKPTLNEEFLTVDSDSLNNIFAVDKVEEKYKNSDKFLCQFYFQYSQKTMIPKHGVASLE